MKNTGTRTHFKIARHSTKDGKLKKNENEATLNRKRKLKSAFVQVRVYRIDQLDRTAYTNNAFISVKTAPCSTKKN